VSLSAYTNLKSLEILDPGTSFNLLFSEGTSAESSMARGTGTASTLFYCK